MKQGKLIVIDGADGAGKTTQKELLIDLLKKEGHNVQTMHFPNKDNFFGGFIYECLNSKEFDFAKIPAKIASALYAADRWQNHTAIIKWLNDDITVILDRYVSANQIHQGGKIKDIHEREQFMSWLAKMEYDIFGIPKPDLTIYLSIPPKVSQELMENQSRVKDAHEINMDFQVNSYECANWLSETIPNFIKIDCAPDGQLLTIEAIHTLVYEKTKTLV